MTESVYPDRDGRLFVDLARDLLGTQLETLDSIDGKIALLFTTSTTLVGILAAVLALRGGKFDTVSYVLVGVSVVAYLRGSWSALKGYRAQTWRAGPDLKQTWNLYTQADWTDRQLEWLLGNHLRVDYVKNGPAVETKTKALDDLLPAIFIQTLTLVLSLVLVAA